MIDLTDCPGGDAAFAELDKEFEAAQKMISYGQQNLNSNDEFAKAFFGPSSLTGSTFTSINNRYKIMKRLATDKDKDRNGININVGCSRDCSKDTNAKMRIGPLGEEMILCPGY